MGPTVTQITVQIQDPLGEFYVPVPGPYATRARSAWSFASVVAGGAVGWVSSQAWFGNGPPLLGTLVFVYLATRLVMPMVTRMSYDISRARMYQAIAGACLAYAALQDLVNGPREELGAQTL